MWATVEAGRPVEAAVQARRDGGTARVAAEGVARLGQSLDIFRKRAMMTSHMGCE